MNTPCKSFQDLELENAPADLDGLALFLPDLEAHLLLPHQRSKFGLIIENEELILDIFDDCVLAGYRDVSYADLAFMSSSDFYALLWSVLDDHYALFLLTCAFKHQVIASWLVHADHLLDVLRAFGRADLHIARELTSADLALKFGEVVVQGAANHFLLDLDADPLGKAFKVHRPTGAVALAGIEQEISLLVVLLEAYLAGVSFLVGVIVELEDVFVEESLGVF